MKRLTWLWGSLLGAVLLPFLMVVSYAIVAHLMPTPPSVSLVTFTLSNSMQALPRNIVIYGPCGAVLGLCSGLLWMGARSLLWRLLCILCGVGTASYGLRDCWMRWSSFYPPATFVVPSIFTNFVRAINVAFLAPMILAALALVFFPLLLRPRPLPHLEL